MLTKILGNSSFLLFDHDSGLLSSFPFLETIGMLLKSLWFELNPTKEPFSSRQDLFEHLGRLLTTCLISQFCMVHQSRPRFWSIQAISICKSLTFCISLPSLGFHSCSHSLTLLNQFRHTFIITSFLLDSEDIPLLTVID